MAQPPQLRGGFRLTGYALSVLVQRYGWRKTIWILDFTAAWAIAVRHHDWQPIDAEQYGAYWRMSRAKAFRDQQRWRAMFPDEPTPNERVIAARREYERLATELEHEPSRAEAAALMAVLPAI